MDDRTLARALDIMLQQWPRTFRCNDVVKFIDRGAKGAGAELRALFYLNASPDVGITTPSSVGPLLHGCADKPVKFGDRTLVLRRYDHGRLSSYIVHDGNSSD
jgi:hypothetical protein